MKKKVVITSIAIVFLGFLITGFGITQLHKDLTEYYGHESTTTIILNDSNFKEITTVYPGQTILAHVTYEREQTCMIEFAWSIRSTDGRNIVVRLNSGFGWNPSGKNSFYETINIPYYTIPEKYILIRSGYIDCGTRYPYRIQSQEFTITK